MGKVQTCLGCSFGSLVENLLDLDVNFDLGPAVLTFKIKWTASWLFCPIFITFVLAGCNTLVFFSTSLFDNLTVSLMLVGLKTVDISTGPSSYRLILWGTEISNAILLCLCRSATVPKVALHLQVGRYLMHQGMQLYFSLHLFYCNAACIKPVSK